MRGQLADPGADLRPYVIAEVIVGTGWSLMLQTERRASTALLEKIGLGDLAQDWLVEPEHRASGRLMVIITWKYIGFAVILFLAGLQGIPEELPRPPQIDGAS